MYVAGMKTFLSVNCTWSRYYGLYFTTMWALTWIMSCYCKCTEFQIRSDTTRRYTYMWLAKSHYNDYINRGNVHLLLQGVTVILRDVPFASFDYYEVVGSRAMVFNPYSAGHIWLTKVFYVVRYICLKYNKIFKKL